MFGRDLLEEYLQTGDKSKLNQIGWKSLGEISWTIVWFILAILIITASIVWCCWVMIKRTCRKYKKITGEVDEIKELRNDNDDSTINQLNSSDPTV